MKKGLFLAGLVLGSALVIAVVAPIVYAYINHYFAQKQIDAMMEMAKERNAAVIEALKADTQRNGGAVPPSLIRPPTSLASGAPVLTFPKEAKTENNYLGKVIAEDIVKQAYMGLHPGEVLPEGFDIMANVNSDHAPYYGQIFAAIPNAPLIQQDLHLEFAWDAAEYSRLATAVLGTLKAKGNDPEAEQILERLLEPTGAKLAKEDVRLSTELQKNPLDAAAHEEAALVLISMALRENSGDYTDSRLFLCRATAHLALADALQGGSRSWNNQIADAALRVIAGREKDSASMLDFVGQQPNCPPAARNWIDALRIWNRQDVTGVTVTAASPRLVKIAWFQTLIRNLPPLVAVAKLESLGKTDEVVDWTRSIMSAHNLAVEIGNRFCEAATSIEYQELGEILKEEGAPELDPGHLNTVFAEPETETVTRDGTGHPLVHIVGTGTFKAATRRHVFNSLEKTYVWLSKWLGDAEEAKTFLGQTTALYEGVPYFEIVQRTLKDPNQPSMQLDAVLRQQKKTWPVNEVPPLAAVSDFVGDSASADVANAFFLAGPPCGTTYGHRLVDVISCLKIDNMWHRDPYNQDKTANLKLLFVKQLAEMRPDSLEFASFVLLAEKDITADAVMNRLSPFFPYNVRALYLVNGHDGAEYNLTESQKENVMKAEAALNPDVDFTYGDYLWNKGRQDEAVEIYRKAVAEGRDQVLMANSVQNLVDYDFSHGKKDEAMTLAQNAGAVNSASGLTTYALLLEKTGDLDGAEKQAAGLRDSYGDIGLLAGLYARHPDKFPGKFDAMTKEVFPSGITSVTLDSFKEPPTSGVEFTSTSAVLQAAGLSQSNIVVAINGSKVDTEQQYYLIRDRSTDPIMNLIVWDGLRYVEVRASPPNHRFMVGTETYGSGQR